MELANFIFISIKQQLVKLSLRIPVLFLSSFVYILTHLKFQMYLWFVKCTSLGFLWWVILKEAHQAITIDISLLELLSLSMMARDITITDFVYSLL